MALLTRSYKQDATYWALTGNDNFGGYTFGPPQHLKVRWEDSVELMHEATGEEFTSNAAVWVKEDLTLGGYLFLGLSDEPDPTVLQDAFRIRVFRKTPDMRNLTYERIAFV